MVTTEKVAFGSGQVDVNVWSWECIQHRSSSRHWQRKKSYRVFLHSMLSEVCELAEVADIIAVIFDRVYVGEQGGTVTCQILYCTASG